MLEEALRQAFAESVAEAPATPQVVPDRAAAVIARARIMRRRLRIARGTVVVMVVVLLASSGLVTAIGRSGDAQQSASGADTFALDLDLLSGRTLYRYDAGPVQLAGVSRVDWIYRMRAGWLYGMRGESIRLLTYDNRSVDLGARADSFVASPDGVHFAWSATGPPTTVSVGAVSATGTLEKETAPVPAGTRPVSFAANRLVVADTAATTIRYGWWAPGTAFTPTWSTAVRTVVGGYSDGAVGFIPDPDRPGWLCVAAILLAAAGPTPGARRCGLSDSQGPLAAVSADARQFAMLDGDVVQIAELGALLGNTDTPPVIRRCPVQPAASALFWVDATRLLVLGSDRLWQCDETGAARENPLPAPPDGDWLLVPRRDR
jgi:hypothetical protein